MTKFKKKFDPESNFVQIITEKPSDDRENNRVVATKAEL